MEDAETLEDRTKNFLKCLDFFPKTFDPCRKQSATGGTASILCWFAIGYLVVSEVKDYLNPGTKFKFIPDLELFEKVELNVDFTVATPCAFLGADVVDTTDQSAILFGRLHEEETWFELDYRQRMHFDTLRRTNRYLSDEYHTLKHQIWKSDYDYFFSGMPPRVDIPSKPKDACRYHGTLTLNKVAGNFHITQGKVLPIPGVHIHVGHIMQDFRGNFSHRVEKFSFGLGAKGIVQPLEGEERTDEMPLKYQYWLQVVPTDIWTSYSRRKTHQYSVRDYARPGKKGEMQGIYFKYDFSAMRVRIEDDGEYFAMFLVRLSSIIGGIYITVGIFNGTINFLWEFILCRSLSKLPK